MKAYVVMAAVLLSLTACTSDGSSSPAPPSTVPPSSSSGTPSTTSTTPSSTPGSSAPSPLEPTTDLLGWKPVPGPTTATVIRSSTFTVSVDQGQQDATISGAQSLTLGGGSRSRISNVLVDRQRVLVVVADKQAERPDAATILDASGGTATLDGKSTPPTTTGGTWAMGQDLVAHATVSKSGAYCLATVSLESGQGDAPWCAEPHHGFRGAIITDAGLSVMGFDDHRPVSCATLLAIDGADATPFDGVTDCQGWDAALLPDGGAVWSEVPKPGHQEAAQFHARVGDTAYDLGPGTTGSLVWCDGAAYFARDPQTNADPAQLLRFTPDGTLAVVYQSKSTGKAFLSTPRCGGDAITITSYGDQGDEQVTANLS